MQRSNENSNVLHFISRMFHFVRLIGFQLWVLFVCSSMCLGNEWNLQSPTDFQVVQRNKLQSGMLPVEGAVAWSAGGVGKLEIRVKDANQGQWSLLGDVVSGHSFSFLHPMKSGGWYRLELRIVSNDQLVTEHVIDHVGVGEVFVVAGQSNSANHGEEKQKTTTGRVASFDGKKTWRLCEDPQPGASGRGGSFMPPLGDLLALELEVPVGFVACGIGATSVREWLPEGFRFPNPPTLTGRVRQLDDGQWASDGRAYTMFLQCMQALGKRGFRSVLWHQGESDANQKDPTRTLSGSLYRDYLKALIQSSRRDMDWNVPWFVAQVSYHVPGDEASPDIRAAQAALWQDGTAFQGPDSDALKGVLRENNGLGVHFSSEGLKVHASRWAEKILPWIESLEE